MRAIALGGQRLEAVEQAGLGTLFANVWGQGSQRTQAADMAAQLARQGGHVGAFGGRNSVGLSVEALAHHAKQTLGLALEVLFAPAFSAADVARERHAQQERIRSRQDSPGGVAIDLFLRTLFDAHPYGLPALGTAKSVAGLDEQALKAYHGRFLAPERLILSVVGPIEPEQVAAWVAEAQAHSGAGEPSTLEEALRWSQPLPSPAPQRALERPRSARHRLQKEQSHVLLGAVGTTVAHADRYALAVLSAVLNGQSGRLFADLRDVQSLAYSLSCSSAEGYDPGHVVVHMASSPSKVGRAIEGVRGHLGRLAEQEVPEAELIRARNMLTGGHAIDLQRAGARAMTHATGELYGLGYDHFVRYDERVRAVTGADVRRVARHYLSPERLCEVVVGQND
jgi:zinc protease